MARTDPQLNFRCPAELKDRLEAAAEASGRSLTQEIVARLATSFELARETDAAIARLEELQAGMTRIEAKIVRALDRELGRKAVKK